jgi:beta-lactamase regulating signal transducer with metallopeptidase domain
METISKFISNELIEASGWALFHSLWQGVLVLAVLFFILLAIKPQYSKIRYYVSFSFLIIFLSLPVFTGIKAYTNALEKKEIRQALYSNPHEINTTLKTMLAEQAKENTQPSVRYEKVQLKSKIQKNFDWVVLFWLIGVFLFAFRTMGGLAIALKLPHYRTTSVGADIEGLFTRLCQLLGIKSTVKICKSYIAKVPMVVGHFKPVVIVPASLVSGLSFSEIEAILAHELAHIKRNDFLINVIQSFIEAIFFFHPAVWIISGIIRSEREHSCDAIAIEITKNRLNYIKALTRAQEYAQSGKYQAVAFANSKGTLLERIMRISNPKIMKVKLTETLVAFGIIILGLTLASFSLKSGKSQQEITPPEKIELLKQSSIDYLENEPEIKIPDYRKGFAERIEKIEMPHAMEDIIEIALAEEDDTVAAYVMKEVERAMKEFESIEIDKMAIEEALQALDSLNIDKEVVDAVEEARAEIRQELENIENGDFEIQGNHEMSDEEIMEITKTALESAEEALGAICIDSISQIAIEESFKALKDINIDQILQDALSGLEVNDSTTQNKKQESLEKELDELAK